MSFCSTLMPFHFCTSFDKMFHVAHNLSLKPQIFFANIM
uniref:Uncharacterized protein n=1 Tax=Anguilla anguilla TaxID=7936 RepID=A0A0E9TWA0_ANGAN